MLAVIGAVLPVMPTVPFLLLSAWLRGQGLRLEAWLLDHATWATFATGASAWGGVAESRQVLACSMMACSAGRDLVPARAAVWLRWGVDGTLFVVGGWHRAPNRGVMPGSVVIGGGSEKSPRWNQAW